MKLYGFDSYHSLLQSIDLTAEGKVPISFYFNQYAYVRIGDTSTNLVVWTPFAWSNCEAFLLPAIDLIRDNVDANGNPKFSIEIKFTTWASVASDSICKGSNTECPDILVLGTTQMPSRVAAKDLWSLNTLFNDYASDTGHIFPDDFLQKYYYDYNYDGSWMGIPLVTDVRALYFNKTTFDTLGLKYPPPYGDWGSDYAYNWTWSALAKYSRQIYDSRIGPGFKFYSRWDEELKLISSIARDYKLSLVTSNNTCGYRRPGAIKMIEEVLRPLFGQNGSANTDYISIGTRTGLDWYNSPLRDPLDTINIAGSSREPPELFGLGIDTAGQYNSHYYHPVIAPNGTIGHCYSPSLTTFLGGSGLAITAKSNLKPLAWEYMKKFASVEYSSIINSQFAVLPPYISVLNKNPKWNVPFFDILKEQVWTNLR
jgi:ABC-type glycerol-3-phosphate transport system substrate-binding protein